MNTHFNFELAHSDILTRQHSNLQSDYLETSKIYLLHYHLVSTGHNGDELEWLVVVISSDKVEVFTLSAEFEFECVSSIMRCWTIWFLTHCFFFFLSIEADRIHVCLKWGNVTCFCYLCRGLKSSYLVLNWRLFCGLSLISVMAVKVLEKVVFIISSVRRVWRKRQISIVVCRSFELETFNL